MPKAFKRLFIVGLILSLILIISNTKYRLSFGNSSYADNLSRQKQDILVETTTTVAPAVDTFKLAEQENTVLKQAAAFDAFCDKQGEWFSIGRDVFIKKTAGFFYTDASLIRIHIIRRGSLRHEFNLLVEIVSKNQKIKMSLEINETRIYKSDSRNEYTYEVINAYLSLIENHGLGNVSDLNSFEMNVLVKDRLKDDIANGKVTLRITRMRSGIFSERKGSIVCAKCLHLTRKDDYLSLKWWIELNRLSGHGKLYMCDHDIEKHQAFTDLFEEYKDFLIL
jgi:hypothetical protein